MPLQPTSEAQPQATREDRFSLLKNLPPDICHRVIFPFLDGKALSTLHLALAVDRSEKASECEYSIQKSAHDRVQLLHQSWQSDLEELAARYSNVTTTSNGRRDPPGQIRPFILRALNCIDQFQREVIDQDDVHGQSRRISEAMILEHTFAFPYDTLGNPCHHVLGPGRKILAPEWPFWCGRIQVLLWVPRGSFHGFERIMLEANVVLLSPNWDQIHYPAWSALGERRAAENGNHDESCPQLDTIQLVAESYNFLPTPPMGRLVGITEKDRETIKTLSSRLSDQNTVAILSPHHREALTTRTRYIDSLRIISRSQAHQRLRSMPSLPFAFYVEGNTTTGVSEGVDLDSSSDLLCCWQYRDLFDNTVMTTARECVPYWKRLVEAREQSLAEGELRG